MKISAVQPINYRPPGGSTQEIPPDKIGIIFKNIASRSTLAELGGAFRLLEVQPLKDSDVKTLVWHFSDDTDAPHAQALVQIMLDGSVRSLLQGARWTPEFDFS